MTKNKFQEYRRKSMMGIVWGTLRIWKWIGRIIAFVSNWVFILILSLYGIVNYTYMIQLEGSRFSGTLFHVSILFHLIYPFVLFFNFPIIIAHRRAKLVNKSYCITHEIYWANRQSNQQNHIGLKIHIDRMDMDQPGSKQCLPQQVCPRFTQF